MTARVHDWLVVIFTGDRRRFPCPICPQARDIHGPTYNIITHLNDEHGWTYLMIADWMDSKGIVVDIGIKFKEGRDG